MSSFIKRKRPLSPITKEEGFDHPHKEKNKLLKQTTESYTNLLSDLNAKSKNLPVSRIYCKSPLPSSSLGKDLTTSIESLVTKLRPKYGQSKNKIRPKSSYIHIKNKAKLRPRVGYSKQLSQGNIINQTQQENKISSSIEIANGTNTISTRQIILKSPKINSFISSSLNGKKPLSISSRCSE